MNLVIGNRETWSTPNYVYRFEVSRESHFLGSRPSSLWSWWSVT